MAMTRPTMSAGTNSWIMPQAIGVHVHVGSQLEDFDAQAETIVRLASFVAGCRDELGWTAQVADLGGGFGIRHHPADEVPEAAELAESAARTARLAFVEAGFRGRLVNLVSSANIGLAVVATLIIIYEFFWQLVVAAVLVIALAVRLRLSADSANRGPPQ